MGWAHLHGSSPQHKSCRMIRGPKVLGKSGKHARLCLQGLWWPANVLGTPIICNGIVRSDRRLKVAYAILAYVLVQGTTLNSRKAATPKEHGTAIAVHRMVRRP
jgi:hypothetical protein